MEVEDFASPNFILSKRLCSEVERHHSPHFHLLPHCGTFAFVHNGFVSQEKRTKPSTESAERCL